MTKEASRARSWPSKALADARPDLLAYLTDLQERFCEAEERSAPRARHALAEAALTVIEAVRREYAGRQAAGARVLDYDDLIVKTLDLLERAQAAQWVLYKLDGGIDHILIDEAQDTSPEQWAIVRKLTEEFFAGEAAGADRSRTIFAVGDEKQSIFSFQGADPAQFDINRHHFERHRRRCRAAFRGPAAGRPRGVRRRKFCNSWIRCSPTRRRARA